ncbi:MAG: hypothetical protein ACFE95_19590 [Candidatus Hodarchaeota archaeon]
MNLEQPPHPYHPLGTSFHYYVPYMIFSIFVPLIPAITLSILIVQFFASLLILCLLYQFFLEIFQLTSKQSLVLVAVYDFLFISPFLLLAVSEILFLFYQLLAWSCFIRRHYFFSAIATAMCFAVRFNGAFFVVGMLLVFIIKGWKSEVISLRLLIKAGITTILMFIIGFSSFILSWAVFGDFWLPLKAQSLEYQKFQGYASAGLFSIPFSWWPSYFQWVVLSNSLFELLYFILGIFTLVLGLASLYKLFKWQSEDNTEYKYNLTLIYVCGFLGVNLLVSGSNFARFLSYTFPVFPIFPLWLLNRYLRDFDIFVLLFGSTIWGILFNVGWWMTYPL